MVTVKDPEPEDTLPPYKYVKTNWEKKLENWQETNAKNQKAKPEEVIDISSKFILKEGNPNYDSLTKRNSLRVVNGIDENLFLFGAGINCKNISGLNSSGPDNQPGAQFGELARTFDEETKKANGGKPIATGKMDSLNNPTYYGFAGKTYQYNNLYALGRICDYEAQTKPLKDRKCSPKLLQATLRLFKYESFGRDKEHTDRIKTNTILGNLYETLHEAKTNFEKNLSSVNQNPLEEKFRMYVTKNTHFIAAVLLLFGGYSRIFEQGKYSKLITKPANLQNLDYLNEAPPRASSLIFGLKKKTITVNSIPTSTVVVDIRYNGLLINYCDSVSGEDCTWNQFQAKIRRLIYATPEFLNECNGDVDMGSKVWFIIVLAL